MSRGRRLPAAALVLITGVGSGAALGACSSEPALHISAPASVGVADPRGVVVTGAGPGEPVTLTASTRSGSTTWTAEATFRADGQGRVDTATLAPTSGSYRGVEATGLMATVAPHRGEADTFASVRETLTLRASQDGRSAGEQQQTRSLLAGITQHLTTVAHDGVEGTLDLPAGPASGVGAVGVVVLGGSEGGKPLFQADGLAQAGHPALAVAYFGAPGVPASLHDIPVETVGRAIRLLAAQPGVDPHRIVVMGASRGSELAALAALHYPDEVAGVALLSPSDTVHVGVPDGGNAWTWRGTPVQPVTIPVQHIAAPMLMVCGTDDQLWQSCPSSQAIAQHGAGHPRTLISETGAGHYVDALVPDFPAPSGAVDGRSGPEEIGGTVTADGIGRLDAWSRTLAWLDRVPALG